SGKLESVQAPISYDDVDEYFIRLRSDCQSQRQSQVVIDWAVTDMDCDLAAYAQLLAEKALKDSRDHTKQAIDLRSQFERRYGYGYSAIVGSNFGSDVRKVKGYYVQMHYDGGREGRLYFILYKGTIE
ncbi:hypothetical protein AAVH_35212, partial [Aphelenchoides avenae]